MAPDQKRANKGEAQTPPPGDIVSVAEGKAVADSRIMAKSFGKDHKDVLSAIDRLKDRLSRIKSPMAQNGALGLTEKRAGADRFFELDREAFALLAADIDGDEARKFEYIIAFSAAEATLNGRARAAEIGRRRAEPLHAESIFGTPLRYFASPDGKGLPWTSGDDLARVFALSANESVAFRRAIETAAAFGHSAPATITTADGPVRIVSHPLALELIETFPFHRPGEPDARQRLVAAYVLGGAAAMRRLFSQLPPAARHAAALAAHHHTWEAVAKALGARGRSRFHS